MSSRRIVDWQRAVAEAEIGGTSDGVDVVVPVFGAAPLLGRCVASVLRHSDLERHRLLLVLDGPQPRDVESVVAAAEGEPGVTVMRTAHRQGFVHAANRGIEASDRDLVLLNSDTEVASGWLDGLARAAYSAPAIASVTPLSNDATICSVPEPLIRNALPTGYDVDALAGVVREASVREYPRVPTGVGFCLLLRRRALEAVGILDEERFGLGYGEENDWCFRALERGWIHVVADDVFVYHAGGGSFGRRSRREQRRPYRILERRHPGYRATIGEWLRRDPLAEVRRRIVEKLADDRLPQRSRASSPPRRILHVVHGWPPASPAGTESYARWLARWQSSRREVFVFTRRADPRREEGEASALWDEGVRVRQVVNNFSQRDPWARNALRNRLLEARLASCLDEIEPELVHVHHLAGHSAGLLRVVARRGLPIVYQIQDWWPACARVNLLYRGETPCPGPTLERCHRCVTLTGVPPRGLWNRLLHLDRRRRFRRALAYPRRFVAGSESIVRWYRERGWLRAGVPVEVLPYAPPEPAGREQASRSRKGGEPLVVGFVGSILPHKGLHLLAEAVAGLPRERLRVEVWGDPSIDPQYTARVEALAGTADLRFRGRFAEEEKGAVLHSLDLLVAPSIGAESFGLLPQEALRAGVPVVASRIPAFDETLAEALEGEGWGRFFEPGDVAELRRVIEELLDEPRMLGRWRPKGRGLRTFEDHAAAMEEVYREVLEGRGPD